MASKRKCLRNVNRETLLVESHHPEVSGTIRRFCATQGPVFALSQHVFRHYSIYSQYIQGETWFEDIQKSVSRNVCRRLRFAFVHSELVVYGFGAASGQLYSYY